MTIFTNLQGNKKSIVKIYENRENYDIKLVKKGESSNDNGKY